MSRLTLVEQASAPDTPGSNQVVLYADSNSVLSVKNDAGTVYGVGGSGVLTIPATGTPALLGTANVFTTTQTIPILKSAVGVGLVDDTATSITFTGASSGILIFFSSLLTTASGMVAFRVGNNLMCGILAEAGSSLLAVTTNTALTGTTGTDGKLTLSAHTDNKLYVENRTGTSFSFMYLVVGIA